MDVENCFQVLFDRLQRNVCDSDRFAILEGKAVVKVVVVPGKLVNFVVKDAG